MNRKDLVPSLAILFIIIGAVTVIWLLANDMEGGPRLIKTSRTGEFLYGVALAVSVTALIAAIIATREAERFRREIRNLSQVTSSQLQEREKE